MEKTQAFQILGLDESANSGQVEDSFRSLAARAHPDRSGGNQEKMSELNEARASALKDIADRNALVPIQTLHEMLVVTQSQALARQHVSTRVAEARKDIQGRTTNRLRKYRRVSTILAAIFAGALFLGKDVPKEIFTTGRLTASELAGLSEKGQAAAEARMKDRNAELFRYWLMMSFGIAIYAGVGAWYFTNRIDHAEHELKDLEEHTSTKPLMHTFLKTFLGERISSWWTLDHLMTSIDEWPKELRRFRRLAREIGSLCLAKYLTDRGLEMGLIEAKEFMEQDTLVERYSIKVRENT